MGRYVFKVPDVGEGTAEAEVGVWHTKVGATVNEDDILVELLTDKAAVEIPSPVAGKIVELIGETGQKRAIGSEFIVFEIESDAEADAAGAPSPVEADAPEQKATPQPATSRPDERPVRPATSATTAAEVPVRRPIVASPARMSPPAFATRTPGEPPQASPAVRRKARELGIELPFVPGSGPGGRITQDDLESYVATRGAGSTAAVRAAARREGSDDIKVIGLRRTIAERLQDTNRRIPHFSYIEEVDVTALESLRAALNARHADTRPKLTLLPFIVRALVTALPHFPMINATFDDDAGVVHQHKPVHAGIATQTPNGLMVTVLRHAEELDVWEAATELSRLSGAARSGKATKAELSGSTITITSLGALGGVATTPIINSPEVAILGINKILDRPVVHGGQVAVRRMMNLSASFDHRVVDGWDAALFIQRIREMLEQPAMLFMENA